VAKRIEAHIIAIPEELDEGETYKPAELPDIKEILAVVKVRQHRQSPTS
jgi:hypothetical protein